MSFVNFLNMVLDCFHLTCTHCIIMLTNRWSYVCLANQMVPQWLGYKFNQHLFVLSWLNVLHTYLMYNAYAVLNLCRSVACACCCCYSWKRPIRSFLHNYLSVHNRALPHSHQVSYCHTAALSCHIDNVLLSLLDFKMKWVSQI